jgi:hypothetical protein
MPGPVGKRDAERRRRNKDGVETITVDLENLLSQEIEIPAPPLKRAKGDDNEPAVDEETGEELWESAWHPIAEATYLSLARSGQAIFYEPSDWHTAYALCEMLSRELSPKPIVVMDGEDGSHIEWVKQPVNGAVMNAFLKGWTALMATEGDRRRLRIELERKKHRDAAAGGDSNVVSIVQNRADLFKEG